MRSSSATRLLGFVALAALFAAPAGSIVYDVPTDAELVAQSPLIVYGRVQYTAPAPDGDFTDATVRVERVLKGLLPGSPVVVRQQGGGGVVVMGLPMLRKGDRALLFLHPGLGGVYRTVGMGLGIFFEDRGHLVRHDVPEDGFRHAERFGRWIEDREAGLARPADYRVEEIPGPGRVRQEANWITEQGDYFCGGGGTTPQYMRWAQWDGGFSRILDGFGECCSEPELSTKVTVTAGGWTDAQALTMTDAAAAMWNGDSGSRVAIPPAGIVVNRDTWLNHRQAIQSFIGVEYGANPGCVGGVKTVRATYEYNGAERPLFDDVRTHEGEEVAVVMFDENGASTHAATNSYRCLKWNQTTQGSGDGTNAGDALCATHEGAYTPQGTIEVVNTWVCDSSHVLGSTNVTIACSIDEPHHTLHPIPGGGGQAHRIGYAWVKIYESAMAKANANQIQTIVAHELGHALGIDHPADGIEAVMSASVATSYTALQPDDRTAVRKLYPVVTSGGAPPSDGGGTPPGSGAVPSEPEPPPPPPPVPPVASFTVDMACADGLCSARTGEDVTFTDTSSGTVARRSWDFETTDRTPSGKSVTHTWSSPGFYRSTLTVEGAGAESTSARMFRVDAASPAGSCVPGPETACLQDSRFEIEVEWQGADGASNAARVVHAGTNDSGLFSFFDRDNWEMLVKVLDGCSINGHHWVYAASATTQPFEISITDTATGEVYRYVKAADELAALADPAAFVNSCAPSR